MRQFKVPDRPTPLIGRWIDATDWNEFLWECENVFDWSERRSQGKRRALLQTTAGAAMTEQQLLEECRVTTLEWFIFWRYEKLRGQEQYPEPVHIDEGIALSGEVQVLRDIYLMMRLENPNIAPVTFRWEQIDGWEMKIAFYSDPKTKFGGIRAQYSPKIGFWASYLRSPTDLWFKRRFLLEPILGALEYDLLALAGMVPREFNIWGLVRAGLVYLLYLWL